MGSGVSTEYVGLKNRSFLLDDLLDFLLPEPGLHVVLHIHHFQVDLIEDRFGPILFIQNRGDAPAHHVVRADFFPGSFLRVFTGVYGLLAPLLAHLFPLALAGDERHFLRVRQFPLQITDEGLHVDVFMALVEDGSDDDDRLATLALGKIAEPGIAQGFSHHGFSHHL